MKKIVPTDTGKSYDVPLPPSMKPSIREMVPSAKSELWDLPANVKANLNKPGDPASSFMSNCPVKGK
jgi:hypothetical protein